uniref:Uncharacterized protein n=1 Tax=Arundo donax TaxID=35708 RepID=A0A0A9AJS9_ARUDO
MLLVNREWGLIPTKFLL